MSNDFFFSGIRGIAGVSLLMSLILLAFVTQRPVVMVAGTLLCAIYALAHYLPTRISSNQLLALMCVSALFIPAFVKPYHGFSPVFYYFSTVASFYAAGAVTRHKPEVLMAAFRLVYWGSIVVISIILYEYRDYPDPLGMVIDGSSSNGIPAYLIVIQIGLSLSNFLVNRRLPVLSTIATGAVAFYGNGRGSLVVAGLIIAASLLFNLKLLGSFDRKRQLLFFLFFATVAIPLAWNAEELIELLFIYTKLSVGLEDGNRIEILNDYLSKIGPWTFLFGSDYSGTVIESVYKGNPHIAFIRTHSFFGLPLTALALVSPMFVFFCRKQLMSKLVFATFIALAVLRASTEPIFFPTLLDFFYFTYFFLFFRYAPSGGVARRVLTLPEVRQ